MFNSNLCDRLIDIGLLAKHRKQYLLVMTPRKTVLYIGQLRSLNLMLFFRGRDHTIVAAKDSSLLDMEIRNKHNQLVIRHGEEQELKQETTAVPACYVPVSLLVKKSIMPARQSGSPRQQYIGVISAFLLIA